jgi:hypothetical protein
MFRLSLLSMASTRGKSSSKPTAVGLVLVAAAIAAAVACSDLLRKNEMSNMMKNQQR